MKSAILKYVCRDFEIANLASFSLRLRYVSKFAFLHIHFRKLVILEYLSVLTIRDLRVFPTNSNKLNLFRLSIVLHGYTVHQRYQSFIVQLMHIHSLLKQLKL